MLFCGVALLPAGVWLTGPEQPLPQLSVAAGQDTGQRLVVVPPQLPSHRHPPSERLLLSPAEQPVALHTPFTGPAVVPPQLPRHCHRPPERLCRWPTEQPVALHAPLTGGEAVQLALVGLPQLGPWHANVAEPLRQEVLFDGVTLVPAEVSGTEPEQVTPAFAQDTVVAGQGHGLVPAFCRLVAQSPSLQHRLQVLVWVKDVPEQTVEGDGDHVPPQEALAGQQGSVVLVPVLDRLVAQSPSLQPTLQVLVWVKD